MATCRLRIPEAHATHASADSGLVRLLHNIHGRFFAGAFLVLPILHKGIGIADLETHFETKGGAEILQEHVMVLQDLGWHVHLVALWQHGCAILLQSRRRDREDCVRRKKKRMRSMRPLQCHSLFTLRISSMGLTRWHSLRSMASTLRLAGSVAKYPSGKSAVH